MSYAREYQAPQEFLFMKKFLLFCLFVLGLGWAIASFPGLATSGSYDSLILDFREDIGEVKITQEVTNLTQKYNLNPLLNSQFSQADHVYIIKGNSTLLESLRKSDLIRKTEWIEPNYIYTTLESPNDPLYNKQWNLRSINVEGAWKETQGKNVTVAVIDSGITKVPDLQETNFVPGYDFVNDRIEADDDNGHGTHVAGTIAQSTNNNYGVAGIAYKSNLMPLKVLSASGSGTVSDIAEAVKFAADHGANVINLSLGGGGESHLLKEAIDYAHNQGVVIIAAAGNSNENSSSYPARYPHVISVSALGPDGEKAPYSNYGAGVDISAPGGSESGKIIQNTVNPETGEAVFEGYEGTSMAAPHVAGVAALIRASGVENPDEIMTVLQQSARVVNEDPLNHFGAGQLDASAAVQLALKGKITFNDFWHWLGNNGYLNPRFWIDGGAVALLPKLAMVIGSYLLAWVLRNYFPFPWTWGFSGGLIAGSSGLFFLRGLYIFDLPQWPFRVMGSSLPELGGAIPGSMVLNPLFASVLIPLILVLLFLGHPQGKWISLGLTLGVASCLTVSAFLSPNLWGLGSGLTAQLFLLINAFLCFGLARLGLKTT